LVETCSLSVFDKTSKKEENILLSEVMPSYGAVWDAVTSSSVLLSTGTVSAIDTTATAGTAGTAAAAAAAAAAATLLSLVVAVVVNAGPLLEDDHGDESKRSAAAKVVEEATCVVAVVVVGATGSWSQSRLLLLASF
jgi:hypothetical protein